jgi:hypothetical protein
MRGLVALQGLAGRPVLYRGTVDCIQQVLRKDGLRGFYAAALPSYLKVRCSTAQHSTPTPHHTAPHRTAPHHTTPLSCVVPEAVLQPN